MKIGGLQPFTVSDFPGHTAAIVFTQGCNFHCPFCHNGRLIPLDGTALITEPEVLSFLKMRRGFLDGVVISGGEPCLQEDLAEFCRTIKAMGFAVKLDTNGSRPEVLEKLLAENLVDFIAMDIKAPLASLKRLTGTALHGSQIQHSISLIAESTVEHLFRTTDVTSLLSAEDHRLIKKMVPYGSPHIVQPFVAEHALSPALQKQKKRLAAA